MKRRRSGTIPNPPTKLIKMKDHETFNDKFGKFLIKSTNTPEKQINTKRQRVKNKEELIPAGYILPKTIYLNKHMNTSHLSKKEFKEQCKGKNKECSNFQPSGKNLAKIKIKLKNLFLQTNNPPADWENYKIK